VRVTLRILAALAATLVVCAALAGGALAAPRIDPHTGRASSGATSTNWAGYSATAGGYTNVTATWTQPAIAATSTETYAAFWVGLDGDGSDTVEQIGTMGYTSGGRAHYVAWYEMYPAAMTVIDTMTISPGDVVTGTVQWTGTVYELTLVDKTSGQPPYTTTQASSIAQRASAEIIAEAPSSAASVLPLATFGLVTFSGCAIDGGTLAAAGAAPIDMIDAAGGTIAKTSALAGDGASFTVTDDFTAPTVTATGLQRSARAGWANKAVTVKLSASDGSGGSGVAATYHALDGGATQTYSGAFSVSGAGSHTVTYWAADLMGNTGSVKTGYVNIDLNAPAAVARPVRLTLAGAHLGAIVRVPVTLEDPLPTCGTAKVVLRLTSRSGKIVRTVIRTGVVTNRTKKVSLRLPSTLKRGVYMLRTRATDAAGNRQVHTGSARLIVR
jgi:hypothetical protein